MSERVRQGSVQSAPLVERINAPGLHEHLAQVVRGLQLPSGVPILDLGCGTGAWLERLKQLGFTNLLGIDADTAQFGAQNVECAARDLEQELRPLERGPFHLVTAIEVIEHIANTGQFVRTLASLLSDDGFGLLTTPNVQSLAARLRFCLTGEMPEFDDKGEPSHITPIVLEALRRILERDGLTVVRVWTFPEHGAGQVWRPALRLVVRIARFALRDPLPGNVLCVLVRKLAPHGKTTLT